MIDIDPTEDERGFFARTWCAKEFAALNIDTKVSQCNLSYNKYKGTIRGMHHQLAPFQETKLVRCIRGSLVDVILDVSLDSPTYKQWVSVDLSAWNYRMVYVPKGFAHGFQTLEDNTEVLYMMSEFYHPELSCGYRWDDPAFNISWPISNPVISQRDNEFPFI